MTSSCFLGNQPLFWSWVPFFLSRLFLSFRCKFRQDIFDSQSACLQSTSPVLVLGNECSFSSHAHKDPPPEGGEEEWMQLWGLHGVQKLSLSGPGAAVLQSCPKCPTVWYPHPLWEPLMSQLTLRKLNLGPQPVDKPRNGSEPTRSHSFHLSSMLVPCSFCHLWFGDMEASAPQTCFWRAAIFSKFGGCVTSWYLLLYITSLKSPLVLNISHSKEEQFLLSPNFIRILKKGKADVALRQPFWKCSQPNTLSA